MMPDMTPWSYPNRKTPNDTKTLVKYLSITVSSYSKKMISPLDPIAGDAQ